MTYLITREEYLRRVLEQNLSEGFSYATSYANALAVVEHLDPFGWPAHAWE